LQRLNNQNIIKYINSEILNDELFIYLEFISGGSLKAFTLNKGIKNELIIKSYINDILNALSYLHKKGIVHRDIKSDNILISDDGSLKLTDFSCSGQIIILDEVLLEDSDLLDSLKGTLLWMAPEVIRQENYGRKVDVWSLGCTLLEIIFGGNPWGNIKIENYFQALYKIGKSNEIPCIPNDISDKLKNFIECCVERDKNKRKSVEELQNHPFLK